MTASFASAEGAWHEVPHSLDAFVRTRNVSLADAMLARFATSRANVAALDSPPLMPGWESYADGHDLSVPDAGGPENSAFTAGNAAYDGLLVLQQTLTSEVGVTLGASIGGRVDSD